MEAGYVEGRGCDRCLGTGYSGRRAVHELLEINTVLAESLARNSPAEFVAAARKAMAGHGLRDQAIALARAAGAWLHIVHVSSPYSIDLITQARASGIKVTCETCPPYLFLTDADIELHGPYAKTNPPIRDESFVEGMWDRVARGDVDIIGTDHSPFLASEKEPGWSNMFSAPPGAPGIEILVPLLLTAVGYGRITLERMVSVVSTNTANMFGLRGRKGIIAVGADADLILVDLAAEGRIDVNQWQSKSRVTARLWHGRQTRGAVVRTLVRGKTVALNGTVVGELGWGRFVAPNPRPYERPFW
jgi:dihydroorotase-like cyclic amidohydrolase